MRWTLSGRDSRPELRVKLSMSERWHLQPNRWQVFALHQRMDGNENCHLSFHHLHNNNNLVFFVSFRPFHPTPFIDFRTGQGEVCANPCPDGTWGSQCSQRCSCHNNARCDHINGTCHCLPGYRGDQVSQILFVSNIKDIHLSCVI